jgi:type IX secretion system PorP/SprF family membrane protein
LIIGVSAQDIHFSQFYASPLNLNPALTGVFEGNYRATAIYRNQWSSISSPFVTYSGSFDIKLLEGKLPRDVFAVGANFYGDKAGNGKLSNYSAFASASFNKSLDKKAKHFIGLGVSLGWSQRSLNAQSLAFPSQFNNGDFDLTQSNGENFGKTNFGYFDVNAGILQQSNFKDVVGLFNGFTVYHLAFPKESFLNDNYRLKNRFTIHGGLRIRAAKNFYITPNYIVQLQNKAREINVGSGLEYHIPAKKTNVVVSLGAWYRIKDAAIVSAGLEFYRLRIMAAYDINTSALKTSTNGRGGFEIALIYTGLIKSRSISVPILVPCPRM